MTDPQYIYIGHDNIMFTNRKCLSVLLSSSAPSCGLPSYSDLPFYQPTIALVIEKLHAGT
jgi:hypothetical protein